MFRLLIVDDEEIIVDGLYDEFTNLKNQDLDVYKAYSGEEALEWLNRTRMDIVLTDIRMPGIDGLQLLEFIQKNWPQCRVIFLTGYNEFDYVYKALQNNVASYILKTEDYEKIIEAVERAIQEIQNEIKTEDFICKAKEQINVATELFQNDYLIHLLHDDPFLTINKSQFEQLSIPMQPEKPVILIVGRIDNMPTDFSYWDKIQYLYGVRNTIVRKLKSCTRSVLIMDESYRFVIFVQPKELLSGRIVREEANVRYEKTISLVKGTLELIQTTCRESMDTSVSFVLIGEPCEWNAVSKNYNSLNQLLNFRIGTGTEMLLILNELNNPIVKKGYDVPELEADSKTFGKLFGHRKLDSLELYLESGQNEKYFEELSVFIDPIKGFSSKNSNVAIEAYCRVALCLLSYINRYKLTENIAFLLDQNRLMRIDKHESWEEAVNYIYSLSEFIFKIQKEQQKKQVDNEIEYIEKFVEEHLDENLSLVRLAELVSLNPSYLSRLYKQSRGTNLSDFIEIVRINKAKAQLERGNLKIHEIAKSVGYETAGSFTRLFRKLAGCSPQEYQEAFMLSKKMMKK